MACSKTKYFQSFKERYSEEFTYIKASRKGDKYSFCELCRCDFSISHGGRYDITRHLKSAKHIENTKCCSSSTKLDKFFKNDEKLDVSRAELLFTSFLVEHNVPLAAADHAGPLFRKMFPQSEIAKQYGCGRTKTTALISEMASSYNQSMIKQMKLGPFSAACDGSNDTDYKLYPVVVSFFNPSFNLIQSSLLSLPNLTGDATGENISSLIVNEFKRFGVPPTNCIAFMSDNASVMQGKKNGVVAHLKRKHENIITLGCSCHLVNLACEKATSALPIKVDEMLVDIFYYLNRSAKRKETLKHFQALHDKEAHRILKHVCTRWLSLGRSLTRLVDQWDPLLSYFKETVKLQASIMPVNLASYQIPKVKRISNDNGNVKTLKNTKDVSLKRNNETDIGNSSKKLASREKKPTVSESTILTKEGKIFMFLSSKECKAYCFFLLNSLPIFEKANTILQSGAPYIHKLRQIYLDLLKELLCRFLKPCVLKKSKDLFSVKYHLKENQREWSDIVTGSATAEEAGKLSEVRRKTIFNNILGFYIASCDYIVNKFHINSEVLKNAEVADLVKIESSKFSSVKYFLNLFPCMLKTKSGETRNQAIDELEKQFCSLQIEDISGILESFKRTDAMWVEVGKIEGVDGLPKYRELSEIMIYILLIPHSNAECERIFSVVKKNRNEFRSSLSNKTVENLLIMKTNNSKPCFEQLFSQDFLTKAKKATYASLSSTE